MVRRAAAASRWTVPPSDQRDVCLAVSIATSPYVPIERALSSTASRMSCRFTTWPKASGTCIRCRTAGLRRRLTADGSRATPRSVLPRWDDDIVARPSSAISGLAAAARGMDVRARRRCLQCARFFIPEVAGVSARQRDAARCRRPPWQRDRDVSRARQGQIPADRCGRARSGQSRAS